MSSERQPLWDRWKRVIRLFIRLDTRKRSGCQKQRGLGLPLSSAPSMGSRGGSSQGRISPKFHDPFALSDAHRQQRRQGGGGPGGEEVKVNSVTNG